MPVDNMTPAETEPKLDLLLSNSSLEEPLWRSLFRNFDDFFFPKKQPPLVLTSRPVPVKDIWGFYDYKKNGALGSTVLHILALSVLIGMTILGRRVVEQVTKPHETVTRSEEHTSELQSRFDLVCRLLLEKKKIK